MSSSNPPEEQDVDSQKFSESHLVEQNAPATPSEQVIPKTDSPQGQDAQKEENAPEAHETEEGDQQEKDKEAVPLRDGDALQQTASESREDNPLERGEKTAAGGKTPENIHEVSDEEAEGGGMMVEKLSLNVEFSPFPRHPIAIVGGSIMGVCELMVLREVDVEGMVLRYVCEEGSKRHPGWDTIGPLTETSMSLDHDNYPLSNRIHHVEYVLLGSRSVKSSTGKDCFPSQPVQHSETHHLTPGTYRYPFVIPVPGMLPPTIHPVCVGKGEDYVQSMAIEHRVEVTLVNCKEKVASPTTVIEKADNSRTTQWPITIYTAVCTESYNTEFPAKATQDIYAKKCLLCCPCLSNIFGNGPRCNVQLCVHNSIIAVHRTHHLIFTIEGQFECELAVCLVRRVKVKTNKDKGKAGEGGDQDTIIARRIVDPTDAKKAKTSGKMVVKNQFLLGSSTHQHIATLTSEGILVEYFVKLYVQNGGCCSDFEDAERCAVKLQLYHAVHDVGDHLLIRSELHDRQASWGRGQKEQHASPPHTKQHARWSAWGQGPDQVSGEDAYVDDVDSQDSEESEDGPAEQATATEMEATFQNRHAMRRHPTFVNVAPGDTSHGGVDVARATESNIDAAGFLLPHPPRYYSYHHPPRDFPTKEKEMGFAPAATVTETYLKPAAWGKVCDYTNIQHHRLRALTEQTPPPAPVVQEATDKQQKTNTVVEQAPSGGSPPPVTTVHRSDEVKPGPDPVQKESEELEWYEDNVREEADGMVHTYRRQRPADPKIRAVFMERRRLQREKDQIDKKIDALEQRFKDLQRNLEGLNAKDFYEVKNYKQPPELVELTLAATMVIVGEKDVKWEHVKAYIKKVDIIVKLKGMKPESISSSALKKLKHYINDPRFVPENVATASFACSALSKWIFAVYDFHLQEGSLMDELKERSKKLHTEREELLEKLNEEQKLKLQEFEAKLGDEDHLKQEM